MDFSSKIFIITLILASTTIASGTGACTVGACAYCEMKTTEKYCRACYKTPIFGGGVNWNCSGGTAITGCLVYATVDDNDTSKAYCFECDNERMYYLKKGITKDLNTCEFCDLTKNYLKEGLCTTATVVAGCTMYSKVADNCSICAIGKSLVLTDNKCVSNI